MGGVWGKGSKYTGPHGVVYWLRLAYRSPGNLTTLSIDANVRTLASRTVYYDPPAPPPPIDPNRAGYVEPWVMAWNGGQSDVP
jgi:hypothetical protein